MDHVLLLGDFNSKIGNYDGGITGGDLVISKSGLALRKCTQEYNLDIVNRLDVCDGKWTRVNARHSNQRSISGYVISLKSLTPSRHGGFCSGGAEKRN